MVDTQEILFGVAGQSLVFDCPEGRPSSVTSVAVHEIGDDDDATAETATTGAAAVETNPNTTLAAASGTSEADGKRITLTAITGIATGRRYLVSSAASGEGEWVDVAEVGAGYCQARVPLANDYAAADTFASTRVSIGVDPTWVALKTNISDTSPGPRYRVRWVYVVAGVTYAHASYIDLVRYKGTHTVTGLDVDQLFSGWLDTLGVDDREDQGAGLIAAAYRAVKLDMYADGKADQGVRNGEVVDELVLYKANQLAQSSRVQRGGGNPDALVIAANGYAQRYQQLIREPKIVIDLPGGGGGVQARRLPLWRR